MLRLILVWLLALTFGSPCTALTFRDKLHAMISKGNRHYHSGKHEKALESYRSAMSVDSTHAICHFNAGDALYLLGRYQDGVREFTRAIRSETDSVAAMSYYNLGNALFKSGDLKSAVEAYKRSLLIDPTDEDAKYNLELALRLLEQQKQQNQGQKQEERGSRDQQGDENQSPESENRREQEQTDQRDQKDKEKQPQAGQEIKIRPEDLNRILTAIEASDRQVQQELLKRKMRSRRITGKDW